MAEVERSTDADSGREDRLGVAAAEVLRSVVSPSDALGCQVALDDFGTGNTR